MTSATQPWTHLIFPRLQESHSKGLAARHDNHHSHGKNDPIKKAAKQQKTNQTAEWLIAELQKRPGYDEFRDSFHQVRHNPDTVRSWTLAVDFTKAFNRLTLIVRAISEVSSCTLFFSDLFTEWFLQKDQKFQDLEGPWCRKCLVFQGRKGCGDCAEV